MSHIENFQQQQLPEHVVITTKPLSEQQRALVAQAIEDASTRIKTANKLFAALNETVRKIRSADHSQRTSAELEALLKKMMDEVVEYLSAEQNYLLSLFTYSLVNADSIFSLPQAEVAPAPWPVFIGPDPKDQQDTTSPVQLPFLKTISGLIGGIGAVAIPAAGMSLVEPIGAETRPANISINGTSIEQDLQPTPVPTPVATELERIRQSIPDLQVETFKDKNGNTVAILTRTQSRETLSTLLVINQVGEYFTAPINNTAELHPQPTLPEALAEIGITLAYTVNIRNSLNFRSDPAEGSQALTTIPAGESVKFIKLTDDETWVQIQRSDGQVGWIATNKYFPGGAEVVKMDGGGYTIADGKTVSAVELDRLTKENAEREARLLDSFDKNSVSDWNSVLPEGTLLRLEAKKIVESYPEKYYSVDQSGRIVEHPSPTTWKVIDNNLYALDAQGNIVLEFAKHAGWSIPKTITTRSFPIRVLLSQRLQKTNGIVDIQLTDEENVRKLDGSFHQFGPSTMDEKAKKWAKDAFGGAEYSTFPEDGKLGEQSVTEAMVYLFVMLRNGRSNEMSDISQQVKDTFKQLESGSDPLTVRVGNKVWDLRNGGVEIVVTLSHSPLGADVNQNGKLILYLNLIDESWNSSETFANQLQAVMLNLLQRESALRDEWTDSNKYYLPEIYKRLWQYMVIDGKETRVPAIQVITQSGDSAQIK